MTWIPKPHQPHKRRGSCKDCGETIICERVAADPSQDWVRCATCSGLDTPANRAIWRAEKLTPKQQARRARKALRQLTGLDGRPHQS